MMLYNHMNLESYPLWVSLLTLVAGLALHGRIDGMGQHCFGAMGETGEAFALVLFASVGRWVHLWQKVSKEGHFFYLP
jgi:hypothetical protein